jgi:transcriptional regulator GlxA family with amidase domain
MHRLGEERSGYGAGQSGCGQRVSLAEELLETTSLPVEQIAERVGYRSAAVFREQFAARRGLAPRDYRRAFSHATRQAGTATVLTSP